MRRDDFIAMIVNYETNKLTKDIRVEANERFISNPNFNFTTANHASKACGPLVEWVIAQVAYANILEKVEPLREEVGTLQLAAEKSRKESILIQEKIALLDSTIYQFKEEYAELVREVEVIKLEMGQVKKVTLNVIFSA